ncbi:MAG: universal stress protein [Desulfobacter sp.]|nr:MAG: universal stress protein [Desulfobacter sp.]
MFKHILLCTHSTEGAQKAEAFVFDRLEKDPALRVSVLTVLDEDWRGMTGDDWLNSSKSHATFLDHVETQVTEEIQEEWDRIRAAYPAGARAEFYQQIGNIAETIARAAGALGCDLIVIGPWQKSKGLLDNSRSKGLRDRIKNKDLHPLLPCPLMIIP